MKTRLRDVKNAHKHAQSPRTTPQTTTLSRYFTSRRASHLLAAARGAHAAARTRRQAPTCLSSGPTPPSALRRPPEPATRAQVHKATATAGRRAVRRKLASKMRLPLTPTTRRSTAVDAEADRKAESCQARRARTRGQCRVQRAILHWRSFLQHLVPDRAARCVADAISKLRTRETTNLPA